MRQQKNRNGPISHVWGTSSVVLVYIRHMYICLGNGPDRCVRERAYIDEGNDEKADKKKGPSVLK